MKKKILRETIDKDIANTIEELQDIFKEVLLEIRPRFPSGFWSTGETLNVYHAKVVTKYLVEDILKWNHDEVIKYFDLTLFKKYKLLSMFRNMFNGSPMAVLENAYPGEYNSKEMMLTFPHHCCDISKKEALRLRKLLKGMSHEEIIKQYDRTFCIKHRFFGLMQDKSKDMNKFKLLDAAFPNEFHEWEFLVPENFWALKENRKQATLWLMEKESTRALTIIG